MTGGQLMYTHLLRSASSEQDGDRIHLLANTSLLAALASASDGSVATVSFPGSLTLSSVRRLTAWVMSPLLA